MTRKLFALVLSIGVLMPCVSALGQTGADGSQLARLEQRTAQLEGRLRGKTGARERQELQRQQRAIDSLIARLAAGEEVAPEEIDAVLGGSLRLERSR
jgi:hypothetical protein